MFAEAEVRAAKRVIGGGFLIEDLKPEDIFTLEDLTPEQRDIANMTSQFAQDRVLANAAAIEAKQWNVSRELMLELGELGLLGVDVPEEYGGLGLDKITSALVTQSISVLGSFNITFSAHVGIGTLPLIWYGTPEQKAKYLPKLVTGEWIACYALSEASAGSDAMNIRSKAVLSPDGKHYLLNGEKMWISNAGLASLFTIFAKIDGEKFTAFLVEKGTEGLSLGPEEHKLGLRGSSTCPVILNDCKVPVENVLGTPGKGHHIAFNILNVGRYKLAAHAVGGAKTALRNGIRYAKDRKAFGKSITQFGLVQQLIAEAAAGTYALESTLYRVVGAIDAALAELDKRAPNYSTEVQKRIEEFAAECSILKVSGSEIVERAIDNMLQVHGGYGYVEEFPLERAYRDARVNRIFEGTNEINRLLTTGWIMKRALQGALPLLPAIKKLTDEVMAGPVSKPNLDGLLAREKALLASAKNIALFAAGVTSQALGSELAEQQEVMASLADIVAEVLLLESTILRTEKMAEKAPVTTQLTEYYAAHSFRTVENAAERVLGAVAEGDTLRTYMAVYRRLSKHDPTNTVASGREISEYMVQKGHYSL